jgi:hypothetical protein
MQKSFAWTGAGISAGANAMLLDRRQTANYAIIVEKLLFHQFSTAWVVSETLCRTSTKCSCRKIPNYAH